MEELKKLTSIGATVTAVGNDPPLGKGIWRDAQPDRSPANQQLSRDDRYQFNLK